MSEKNKTRNVTKCVICTIRNAQLHSLFCDVCITTKKAEARVHLNMVDAPHDPREDTLRKEPRGWM